MKETIIIVLVFIGIIMLAVWSYNGNSNECEAKGGIYNPVYGGGVCTFPPGK